MARSQNSLNQLESLKCKYENFQSSVKLTKWIKIIWFTECFGSATIHFRISLGIGIYVGENVRTVAHNTCSHASRILYGSHTSVNNHYENRNVNPIAVNTGTGNTNYMMENHSVFFFWRNKSCKAHQSCAGGPLSRRCRIFHDISDYFDLPSHEDQWHAAHVDFVNENESAIYTHSVYWHIDMVNSIQNICKYPEFLPAPCFMLCLAFDSLFVGAEIVCRRRIFSKIWFSSKRLTFIWLLQAVHACIVRNIFWLFL